MEWPSYKPNRLCFLLWERCSFDAANPAALRYVKSMFVRLGGSKVIEDSNNRIRHMHAHDQGRDVSTRPRRFYALVTSNVPASRHVDHFAASVDEFTQLDSTEHDDVSLTSALTFPDTQLPQSWSRIMGKREWLSPTAEANYANTGGPDPIYT